MPDLWPDNITSVDVTTPSPLAILKEQAAALGQKTANIVEGNVNSAPENARELPGDFWYSFHIVGPVLGNYRYRLFRVGFPHAMYPVSIIPDEDVLSEVRKKPFIVRSNAVAGEFLEAKNDKEFKDVLQAIFGAEKTKRVIQAILSQSRG